MRIKKSFKKVIIAILCLSLLASCFPLNVFAANEGKMTKYNARALANFYGATLTFIDSYGNIFNFGDDFVVYDEEEVVNKENSALAYYIFTIESTTSFRFAYIVINKDLYEPALFTFGMGFADNDALTELYNTREQLTDSQRQQAYADNITLIDSVNSIINSEVAVKLTSAQAEAVMRHYAKDYVLTDSDGNEYCLGESFQIDDYYIRTKSYYEYDNDYNVIEPTSLYGFCAVIDGVGTAYFAIAANMYAPLFIDAKLVTLEQLSEYSANWYWFMQFNAPDTNKLTDKEKQKNYEDNKALLESLKDEITKIENGYYQDGYNDNAFVKFFKDLFKKIAEMFDYLLRIVNFDDMKDGSGDDRVWFGDMEVAQEAVDLAVREYAAENSSTVKNSYVVDKNYCKPHSQSYFADDDTIGDGACGIAAWIIALSYYRDAFGYNFPDDQTMFNELIAIYDEIDEEAKVLRQLMKSIEDAFKNAFDVKLGLDGRPFEYIGFLDVGIYRYLKSKGYENEANNEFKNLKINIPILSEALQKTLLNDTKSSILDIINPKANDETISDFSYSAKSVIINSLKKGEPAVIGNWMAIGYNAEYTNHYFTAVGLYEIETAVALPGGGSYSYKRNIVEIYNNWTDRYSALLDLDAFNLAAFYGASSIASL